MSDDGAVETERPDGAKWPGVGPYPTIVPLAPEPPLRRSAVLAVSSMVSALLMCVAVFLPLPFVVVQEGPTYDLFDTTSEDRLPLLVSGEPTYDTSGPLRMTTVQVWQGADSRVTLGPVVRSWLSTTQYVYPDVPRPVDDGNGDDQDAAARQDWLTAQERASVAALTLLNIPFDTTITVVGIQDASNANNLLKEGDRIYLANGVFITKMDDLSGVLGALTPGDPVTVSVSRDGYSVDVTFDTIDDGTGKAVMGIWINPDFELPINVIVNNDKVSGPSAGMMFALAIIETLTPQDESGGVSVAGTGTIDIDGDVGPIGGIDLKLVGAARDGATWFLAPAEDCPEVIGHIPDGLNVVSVDTLSDAYAALIAIGEGDTSTLPTCS